MRLARPTLTADQLESHISGGGSSPWSLSSQPLFDYFKATARPETPVTYELGLRASRTLDAGPLTGFDGQVSLYHVDFHDRQLAISTNKIITSYAGGTSTMPNSSIVSSGRRGNAAC
jgi:hypothetical protein